MDVKTWISRWIGNTSDLNVSAADLKFCYSSRLYQSIFHKFENSEELAIMFQN